MAERRMLAKTISTSRKINKLSDRAALIYTWMIPHTDDFGHLEGDPVSIRAKVVPMRNIDLLEIEKDLKEMENCDVIKSYQIGEEMYIEITNFDSFQTFRADRERRMEYPAPSGELPKKNKKEDRYNYENKTISVPRELEISVYLRDGKKCRYCSSEKGPFEIDHVHPVSRGGIHEITNLVVSCQKCNRIKKDNTIEEIGWHLTTNDNQSLPCDNNRQRKLREVKLSKDKISTIPVAKATSSPKKAKKTPTEKKADENEPCTLEEFCTSMRKSTSPHIVWLADYAEEKKPNFKTKGQWRVFIERNTKAARDIRRYSDEQIEKAYDMVQQNMKTAKNPKGYITKWGIETLLKFLIEAN